MSKIDVSQWKEFKVGDLLTKVKTKKIPFKALDLPVNPTDNCDLPLVAAGVDNQGRGRYVDSKYATVLHGCLTVSANGANSGATFYQDSDFSILQDAYALELVDKYKSMGMDNIYLFLATVIRQGLINNNWSNKATWTRVQKTSIKLPVTSSGEPDWQYMDSYIAKRAALAHKYVSELTKAKDKPKPLNVNGWKEFKLSSMFDVNTSKSVDRRYLDFVDDSDAVDFVGRGTLNNGIQGRISPEHVSFKPNSAYTMSLSQIGNNWATWHDTPWFASQNIFVLTPISKRLAGRKARYFIQSVINRNLIMYYNRGYEKYPKQSDIRDMMLTLPVDSSGNPDWHYMDEYIAKRAVLAHKYLSEFKSTKN